MDMTIEQFLVVVENAGYTAGVVADDFTGCPDLANGRGCEGTILYAMVKHFTTDHAQLLETKTYASFENGWRRGCSARDESNRRDRFSY